MGWGGIKAVTDYKVYTAGSILDLLHFVAPKMMQRGGAHFSYGIANNLDDPEYKHYKYWSNPLETKWGSIPIPQIISLENKSLKKAAVFMEISFSKLIVLFMWSRDHVIWELTTDFYKLKDQFGVRKGSRGV